LDKSKSSLLRFLSLLVKHLDIHIMVAWVFIRIMARRCRSS
jgi:hypothetical protein